MTPHKREKAPNPVRLLEIRISLSGESEFLQRMAKSDRRIQVSGQSCYLKIQTDSASSAVAETRELAEHFREVSRAKGFN